jgi:hypothetical protein
MLTNLEIFTEAGTTVEAGVFIPTLDLMGMATDEITGAGELLEGKLAYAFLNGLHQAIQTTTPLGFPDSVKLDPSGVGPSLFTEGVTLNIIRLLDLRANTVSLLPLPVAGANAGQGKLTLADCWGASEKLAGGASTPGAGVLIPDSFISNFGGEIPSTVDSDARSYFAALMVGMVNSLSARTSAYASAIARKTNPLTIRGTGISVLDSYWQGDGPTSGLIEADLPYIRLIRETLTIEYELVLNPDNQTFEISVRTL